jgi:hypothetical protein
MPRLVTRIIKDYRPAAARRDARPARRRPIPFRGVIRVRVFPAGFGLNHVAGRCLVLPLGYRQHIANLLLGLRLLHGFRIENLLLRLGGFFDTRYRVYRIASRAGGLTAGKFVLGL